MRTFGRLLVALIVLGLVGMMSPAGVRAADTPPDLKALMAMTTPELRTYAAQHSINLGDASAHDTLATLIYEAEIDRFTSGSTKAQDPGKAPEIKLPAPELFQPRVPDLSKATVAGRAWSVGLILIGLAAIAVLGVAVAKAIHLAYEIVTGNLSLKTIAMKITILAIGVAVIIAVFGASIYRVITGFYEFLQIASR